MSWSEKKKAGKSLVKRRTEGLGREEEDVRITEGQTGQGGRESWGGKLDKRAQYLGLVLF